ncbi:MULTISPECIES: XRE family transcriptional regulator [unclassified Actinomyces]|uniref:helix-turn-helix domain-containing protein n=1 Tax=unclassified Actinomyces TaxID=2609248 RepID=UPI0020176099|nr:MULTISPECIES: XRE family transcriptional regulator [unclassified Actinomyces]
MIGEVLLVLRQARGLTQAEVAGRVGITQAALSRYEADLRVPDEETTSALADVLGVTQDFLTHDFRMRGAVAADAHMRRRATARPSDWRRVEAGLNELRMHSSYLLTRVPMDPDLHVPSLDPFEVSPAEAARRVRALWRMPIGPVRRLVRWVEAAGVVVVEQRMPSQRIDGMSQWSGDHAVIVLNADMPRDRRRWTVAHELGHLVLHDSYVEPDVEDQANEFAAELLMPAEVIRPQLKDVSLGALVDLKAEWGCSMRAVFERALDLGTAERSERDRFYRRLREKGWKVTEPGSDTLPPEVPELAASVGQRMLDAGLTRDEVAEIIGIAPGAESPFLPKPAPATHLRRVI